MIDVTNNNRLMAMDGDAGSGGQVIVNPLKENTIRKIKQSQFMDNKDYIFNISLDNKKIGLINIYIIDLLSYQFLIIV